MDQTDVPNPYASAAAIATRFSRSRSRSLGVNVPAARKSLFDAANTAKAERAASIEAASLEKTFATSSGRAGIPIQAGNAYTGSASSGPIGG